MLVRNDKSALQGTTDARAAAKAEYMFPTLQSYCHKFCVNMEIVKECVSVSQSYLASLVRFILSYVSEYFAIRFPTHEHKLRRRFRFQEHSKMVSICLSFSIPTRLLAHIHLRALLHSFLLSLGQTNERRFAFFLGPPTPQPP